MVKQWFDMNKFFSLWIENCYIDAERPPVSNGLCYIFGAFLLCATVEQLHVLALFTLLVFKGLYWTVMLAIFKLIFCLFEAIRLNV